MNSTARAPPAGYPAKGRLFRSSGGPSSLRKRAARATPAPTCKPRSSRWRCIAAILASPPGSAWPCPRPSGTHEATVRPQPLASGTTSCGTSCCPPASMPRAADRPSSASVNSRSSSTATREAAASASTTWRPTSPAPALPQPCWMRRAPHGPTSWRGWRARPISCPRWTACPPGSTTRPSGRASGTSKVKPTATYWRRSNPA